MDGYYYHKIENLWKRDPKNFKYSPGAFQRPEFELLSHWDVTEKIDGMSVHIELPKRGDHGDVFIIHGRSSNTQFTQTWLDAIQPLAYKLTGSTLNDEATCRIYGELYGPGINNGGGYGGGIRFAAFDISFGGVFVSPSVFREIAKTHSIETAPYLGSWTLDDIDDYVSRGFASAVTGARVLAEGVIAKSPIELKNNAGKRLMFKHKTKDF